MDNPVVYIAVFIVTICVVAATSIILQNGILHLIHTKISNIMSSFTEIKTAFEEHKLVVAQERIEVHGKLDSLLKKIDDLQKNTDGGTPEERAALLADIKKTTQEIKDYIPNDPAPAPGDDTDDTDTDTDSDDIDFNTKP